tara:strand:+ start:12262 stop:12849 length:588 start_codon:yes stop_codon:yes gene_type:complete
MKFTSQDKINSRSETIIKPYRKHFANTIPPDKQYWTLCAECNHPESEYNQVINNGLIQPENFHGVDLDAQAIDDNISHCEGKFFLGDIFQVMANHEGFNPAIINLDFLRTFNEELNNIRKVILMLAEYDQVLLSFNVLIGNFRVKHRDPDDIIYSMRDDPDIAMAICEHGWKNMETYLYKGKGHKTLMASVTMFK